MSKYKEYDYVIIGAGIAGCSLSYFLNKYSNSVLLIDRNDDVALGASGAAGAFLSPLLGKPNELKNLVSNALKFSHEFYKNNFFEFIELCGTCRIPKDEIDREKFKSYESYMDFKYSEFEDGYFFDIGSVVDAYNVCKSLSQNSEKLFSYNVNYIKNKDNYWYINDEIKCKKLLLTTGANIELLEEEYFKIRPVWGQKINVSTTSCIDINYHKECSLSKSKKINTENKNIVSIGATHHRFDKDMKGTSFDLSLKNINKLIHNSNTKSIIEKDNTELLKLANDIKKLDNVEVLDIKIGARASSLDYFPILGKLVDSKKSIEKYPHIVNGSFIKEDKLEMIENLYVLNGVGGRGFVLSPYLANELVENIINNKEMAKEISSHRLFKRWAKKIKNNKN